MNSCYRVFGVVYGENAFKAFLIHTILGLIVTQMFCSHSYIFMYIFFIPLHLCVYKVVVLELLGLDYSLVIAALSELEAQAFRYTRINIC